MGGELAERKNQKKSQLFPPPRTMIRRNYAAVDACIHVSRVARFLDGVGRYVAYTYVDARDGGCEV